MGGSAFAYQQRVTPFKRQTLNALDWVVSSGELVNKRVALIGASPMETGASYALEALERTIRVMSADVVETLSVAHTRAKIDRSGAVVDRVLLDLLEGIGDALVAPGRDGTRRT